MCLRVSVYTFENQLSIDQTYSKQCSQFQKMFTNVDWSLTYSKQCSQFQKMLTNVDHGNIHKFIQVFERESGGATTWTCPAGKTTKETCMFLQISCVLHHPCFMHVLHTMYMHGTCEKLGRFSCMWHDGPCMLHEWHSCHQSTMHDPCMHGLAVEKAFCCVQVSCIEACMWRALVENYTKQQANPQRYAYTILDSRQIQCYTYTIATR